MLAFKFLAVLALVAASQAQDFDFEAAPRPAPARVQPGYSGPASNAPKPTPVPILKQINRHNEDGSYTYGYEGADGSFKIETKLPNGEVKGKYGYVDDTGKVRVVEYGATKYGFEPSGEGITVAPPTLVDETTDKNGNLLPEFSGSYYDQEQPQAQPARAVARPRPRPQSAASFEYSGPQQFEPAQRAPAASPVPSRAQIPGAAPVPASVDHSFDFDIPSRPAPQRSYAPAPSPARSFAPAQRSYAPAAPRHTEISYANDDFDIPAARPSPKITYAQPVEARQYQPAPAPAPAARPAPQYAPRPSPSVGRSGGILDQLSKDYALPQGGAAPLHDISFGYY